MRSQKNVTILTYIVAAITIILLVIYVVDYRIKDSNYFYQTIINSSDVKYNSVVAYIDNRIDKERQILYIKGKEFIEQKIGFADKDFADSINVIGDVEIVPYADLNQYEKDLLLNQTSRYTDDEHPLILIIPIIDNDYNIGAIISKYDAANYRLLINDYYLSIQDRLYIINNEGDYIFGLSSTNNIIDTFNCVTIKEKSISNILDYIKTTNKGLLKIEHGDKDYYFYFNDYYDQYIILESNALFLDQNHIYSQNTTTNFIIRILILVLSFFVFLIFAIYYRNKSFRNNELKIEALNNSISGGIILAARNADLRILYGNDGFYSLIGYSKTEVMESFDNCLRRLVYNKDSLVFDKIISNLNAGIESDYKLRLLSKSRELVWVHMNISIDIERNNTVTIVLLDITESKIRNTEIKNLIASIPGCVLKIDARTWQIDFASDSLYLMLGYEKNDFKNKFHYFYELIHTDDLEVFERERVQNKDNIIFEVRLVKKDGYLIWISFNGKKAIDENNQEIFQTVVMDITEKMDTINALKKETDRISTVLEMTDEFIFEYLILEDRLITTRKFSDVYGSDSIIENFFKDLMNNDFIYPDDLNIIKQNVGDLTTIHPYYQLDIRLMNRQGLFEWFNVKSITLYEDGLPYKVIIKLTNIDEERKKIERLLDISKRDALTGLFNNNFLARNVNEYLTGHGKLGNHCFILFDIDDFKRINDRYGHMAGDIVIKEYTNRLKNFFGIDDIIGRIGGDEVGALLKNTNRKVAYEIMNKLHVLLQEPIFYDGKDIILTSSYGISIFPYDGSSYEELFKKSDIACYYSKDRGKNFYSFYDDSMSTNEHEFKNLTYRSSKTYMLIFDTIQLLDKGKNIINVVRDSLLKISEHFNFDYIHVFESEEEYGVFKCSYSFIKDSNELLTGVNVHNPASVGLMGTIKKDSILYISDLATLANELPDLYKAMMKEKTKSVIITGIFEQGELRGIIGFGSYEMIPYPSQQEIVAIVAFVRLLMSHIYKLRENQKLSIGHQMFQGLLSNQELNAYAVDTNTFELIYISPRLKKNYPHLKLNTKCYMNIYNQKDICINCPLKFIGNNERYSTHLYDENSQKWLGVTASKLEWHYENREAALIYTFDITGYIEKVSFRDPLTGLYNLSKFILEGNKILASNNVDNQYCITAVDITYLRYINETMGYNVGEKLLITLSENIHNEIRNEELCCRNNDKFIMMFKVDDDFNIRLNRFRKLCLGIFDKIIGSSNKSFTAGVYFIKADDKEILEAINKAELARHTTLNIHHYAVYNDQMLKHYEREKELEKLMVNAIVNEEFKTYYQPKYDINSLQVVGLEALTRWHTEKEIISPNEYIPLFNKNGFIDKMSYYCIEQVAKTLRDWIDKGFKIMPVAINISYNYLINNKFVSDLVYIADKYNLDHHLIEIELQELVFKEDVKPIFEALAKVRQTGFKTTIDDFGSGYSSLIMLKELPIDMLKLDKSFLKNGIIEDNDIIIIKNIINMANELGLTVISEGVESLEQLEFLKAAGCQYVQGFYLSLPLSLDDTEKLISK